MSTITIDIRERNLPVDHYADILTSDDYYPTRHSEITGPAEAFEFKAGSIRDKVKVIRPELVSIKTLRVL